MSEFKLLLVDDEGEFVCALAERLRIRGINPRVALNGMQALKALQQEVPDVMVLDIVMPGIDGFEVLRLVQKDCPQVRVIILTASGSKMERERCLRLGAFAFMQKPVTVESLLTSIRQAHQICFT